MASTGFAQTLHTADVDEATAFLDPQFYASRVVPVDRRAGISAQLAVTSFADLAVSHVTFGAEVSVSFPELDCYQVNLPVAGRLHTRQRARAARTLGAGEAAVYQPHAGEVRDRWSADCTAIGVRITPRLLHRQLARTIEGPITGPLRFGPGPGGPPELIASWRALVQWLHADAFGTHSAARHPLVGERLQEAVVAGLLAITDHQYRERLDDRGGRPVAPRSIRRVVEAVQEHPDRPYTVASLAEIAGLSTRGLQQGFQRHIGTTPMRFLRDTRLTRAHEELRRAEPPYVTVAAVAHRWGFVHLGRFAELYRARYGTSPSQTLRR